MVWNPTNRTIAQTLRADVYYSGLTSKADKLVAVSQEGGDAHAVPIAADDTVALSVSLGPRELTSCAGVSVRHAQPPAARRT